MSLLPETSHHLNEVVSSAKLHHFKVVIALPIIAARLCRNFITAIRVSDLDYLEIDKSSMPEHPSELVR